MHLVRDVTIDIDAAGKAQTIGEGCPRCNAPDATMTLLTSMIRYFMCSRCQWRWQVSRPSGSDNTDL
jgi:hypothetical protein